jgi:outer membrane lipoprotein-sorting protein
MAGGSQEVRIDVKLIPGKKSRTEMAMGKPPATTLIIDDGKTLWTYTTTMHQYMKRPSQIAQSGGHAAESSLPTLALTRMFKDAKAVVTGTRSVQGKPAYIVAVTPVKPSPMGFKRAELVVDQATSRMRRFSLVSSMPGGAGAAQELTTTGVVQSETFDKPIPASAFTFTPPKGVKEMQMVPGMGRPQPRQK